MKEPIKPHEVSLYNHKAIGTEDKPLISNRDYAFLFQQVKDGNYDAFKDADKKYTLEPSQRKRLLAIIENRNV